MIVIMDSYVVRIRLIEELARMNAPVVIKGCILLRMIMADTGISTRRGTKDLDIDWTDLNTDMLQIQGTLNTALSRIEYGLIAVPHREFKQYQVAGFNIMYGEEKVCSCDVNVAACPYTSYYKTPNGVTFIGSSPQNIFADKLQGISTKAVYRRVKDVYDLYLLSHLKIFKVGQTRNILSDRGRELGDFRDFINGTDMMMHAWSKFKGVDNKPDFALLYTRASQFVYPFILLAQNSDKWSSMWDNLFWNGYSWVAQ